MGRKERKRYEDNERVKELLKKEELTAEEIDYMKKAYTGSGGLVSGIWNNGQFFTPEVVTKFTIDMLGITGGRVLEPSCGAGAFLNVLPEECEVTGIEMMHDTARVAELCYPDATILKGDALKTTFIEPFDYAVGNPPFGLPVSDWNFDCGKEGKSEVAFIEHALRNLKDGGKLGMIVPGSLLSNNNTKALRKYILEEHQVLAVVGLPSDTFYHTGTSVKTALLIVQKGKADDNYSVFFGHCEEIGWDKRGRPTGKCDLPRILDAYKFREGLLNGEIEIPDMEEIEDEPSVPIINQNDGSTSICAS